MATSQLSGIIQHLRRAVLLRDGAGLTDGQLLEDYLSRGDEAALAALVRRHGPMVWGVCRRVLRNYHDAEDAFQATFLVFVRKAASIAFRELVANWLYGVAHQTALKARATAAKRKGRERQVTEMPEPAIAEQDQWHDLQPLLDGELSRLPDTYRAVIVLCDLEGKTRKEAARQLACPEGTVAGRLARARAMLANRLAQRGVVLSGGALAAVLSQNVASAVVPPLVVSSTIKAASLLAAGQAAGVVTAKVAALTDGVVKAMLVTKIKTVLAVVLVVGLAVAGGAELLDQTQAADQPKGKGGPPAVQKDQKADKGEPVPPAQTDQERIVGSWVIVNEDSKRKGEPWSINKDKLFMHTNYKYYNYRGYWINPPEFVYRLDAGKTPKQIDIGVAKDSVRIKGIYVLDGDELRLCLAQPDKDRPAAFPEKPAPGVVLILHRQKPGAEQPKAKEEQPAAKPEQKVLTPEEAIKRMPKENVTVQFKVASVEVSGR
jgi:RNA polymerase sigma factor (sigma-70 family)